MHIQVLDINDHAPEFPKYYETFVCENAVSGQVSVKELAISFFIAMKICSVMLLFSIDHFSTVHTGCILSISKVSSVVTCIVCNLNFRRLTFTFPTLKQINTSCLSAKRGNRVVQTETSEKKKPHKAQICFKLVSQV